MIPIHSTVHRNGKHLSPQSLLDAAGGVKAFEKMARYAAEPDAEFSVII